MCQVLNTYIPFMVSLWNYYYYFKNEETGWKRLSYNFPEATWLKVEKLEFHPKSLWHETFFFLFTLSLCLKLLRSHKYYLGYVYPWNVKYLEKIIISCVLISLVSSQSLCAFWICLSYASPLLHKYEFWNFL